MTKLLRVSEVAEQLDLPEDRVYALVREGIIPACRIGRQLRFSPKILDEFVRGGGQGFAGGWRRREA